MVMVHFSSGAFSARWAGAGMSRKGFFLSTQDCVWPRHNVRSDFNHVDALAEDEMDSSVPCQLAQDVFPILASLQERGEALSL